MLRDIRVADKNCPWVNDELKSLMKYRDRLKKAAIKAKSETLLPSFKQARNIVNSLSILLKKEILQQ